MFKGAVVECECYYSRQWVGLEVVVDMTEGQFGAANSVDVAAQPATRCVQLNSKSKEEA